MRSDVVAVVGAVRAGVAGADELRGRSRPASPVELAQHDAAALVWVGLFAVGAELVVEGLREL